MSLNEIGARWGTDKSTNHNYLSLYEDLLNPLKEKNIRFLEIAISSGASLRMWEEFFTRAQIFGADIRSESERKNIFSDFDIHFDETRTTTFTVDQGNIEDLMDLPDNLDVIIDDGGHTMFQQQNTLKTIFDKLNPGGFYILEDLHTSTPDFWDGCDYGRTDTNNTIKLIEDLKNGNISKDADYFLNNSDFLELYEKIESIEIFEIKRGSITSLIRKIV
jgi:SAM-dependent methyltransferase